MRTAKPVRQVSKHYLPERAVVAIRSIHQSDASEFRQSLFSLHYSHLTSHISHLTSHIIKS